MSKLGMSLNQRYRMVGLSIASMAIFLVFSLVQTLNGRSRFDLNLTSGVLMIVAVLLLIPVTAAIIQKSTAQLARGIEICLSNLN